jgi:predicted DNA-binding antitoxin AbrB/MazE fold protein
MTISAKYENGVFKPLEDVQLQEGTVVEVHVKPQLREGQQQPSIGDSPFAGMWKDRTDIEEDSVEYINRLRSSPHRRNDRP